MAQNPGEMNFLFCCLIDRVLSSSKPGVRIFACLNTISNRAASFLHKDGFGTYDLISWRKIGDFQIIYRLKIKSPVDIGHLFGGIVTKYIVIIIENIFGTDCLCTGDISKLKFKIQIFLRSSRSRVDGILYRHQRHGPWQRIHFHWRN